jgi:hypothetical protein
MAHPRLTALSGLRAVIEGAANIEPGRRAVGTMNDLPISLVSTRLPRPDRRTLLVVQSLKDYVAGLPPAKGTKNARRHVV